MWSKKLLLVGRYVDRDTPIHRLDPRTKIIWLAVYVSLIALMLEAIAYVSLALYAIVLISVARLNARELRTIVVTAIPLALITFALHILFAGSSGRAVVEWGVLTVGEEGLVSALLYSSRIGLFLMGTAVVNLTTRPTEFADGLSMLLRPFQALKIPVNDISLMVFVALRFIPLIVEEASTIRMAQISRGHVFGRGPIARVRSLVPIVIPLMTNSVRRAETLALAIESRGYRRGAQRSSIYTYTLGRPDVIFVISAAAAFCLIAYVGMMLK